MTVERVTVTVMVDCDITRGSYSLDKVNMKTSPGLDAVVVSILMVALFFSIRESVSFEMIPSKDTFLATVKAVESKAL